MITQKSLRICLSYDCDTGVFTWIKPTSDRMRVGDIAGCLEPRGYVVIRVHGRMYYAHRLAFLYMTGAFPHFADHINGNKTDNRWANLRSVSRSENARNMKIPASNKSGVIGVFWNSGKRKWTARIRIHQKTTHIGHFDSLDLAAAARKDAERRLDFHPNHGRRDAVQK